MVDEKAAGKPEVKREKQLVRLNAILWTFFFVSSLSLYIDKVYYRSDFELRVHMLNNISINSNNLELTPEAFKHSLATELSDSTIDEITQTKAWSLLEEKALVYSQRLSLYTQEMDNLKQRSRNINQLYFFLNSVSLIAAVITQPMLKKSSKTTKTGTACSS